MSEPLDPLKARQAEEDRAYEAALKALDSLSSFALPLENLQDLPHQLEELNRLWEAPPPPSGSGLRGRFDARARAALDPVVNRQQQFNAQLVRVLNGFVAEESRVTAHLRSVVQTLITYAQRLLPTMDARDRLATAHATLRAELVLEAFDRRLESLHRRIDGMKGLVDRVESLGVEAQAVRGALERQVPAAAVASQALRAAEDSTYVAFENRFRQGDESLKSRMSNYAQRFVSRSPVIDLGCGRGEFLMALKEVGVTGRGVESNVTNVESCQQAGLDVSRGDLLAYLRALPDGSVGGVFAAQVAEHLPPAVLQSLMAEAFRALRRGGLLLLETVNPRSVTGFLEVYTRDLSHERPLHPDTLSFLAGAAGFTDVTVEYLSPVSPLSQLQKLTPSREIPERVVAAFNENVDRLNGLLYGPLEYALVAIRA